MMDGCVRIEMFFWLFSLKVLLLIEYSYQQIYYVSQNSVEYDTSSCSSPELPCKSLQHVVDNLDPSDRHMEIKLMDGHYSLKDTTIECGSLKTLTKILKILPYDYSTYATFFMRNIFIKDCHFELHSVSFDVRKFKHIDNESLSNVFFTDSQVIYSNVTFVNVEHKINLIHSNLSMVDINYRFYEKESNDRIPYAPIVSASSNLKHKPNNYVVLKNWNITSVMYPLVVAHECYVELENIVVRDHYKLHKGVSQYPKPAYLVSVHNPPRLTLYNMTIINSVFHKAILYTEIYDRNLLLITNLMVMKCEVRENNNNGRIKVILENRGDGHLDLNGIIIKNVDFGAFLLVGNQSYLSPIQRIKISPTPSISCNAGFRVGYGSCIPCPPGSYQPNYTSTANNCLSCPPGTFSEYSGQASCEDCQPGTYCSLEGCSKCDICHKKLFTSRRRATGCDICNCGSVCAQLLCCVLVPTMLYVVAGVSLGLIIVPSLLIIFNKSRKQHKQRKSKDLKSENLWEQY